jgi:hypothetical protein
MNTTMKTLSALTIATATLAATALPSSAFPHGGYFGNGTNHHGLLTGQPAKLTSPFYRNFGSFINRKPIGSLFPSQGFNCLACNLPHPEPGHGNNWGHGGNWGWNHWYDWNRRYGWRYRPEIIVEGGPGPVFVGGGQLQRAPAAPAGEPSACLNKQNLPDGSVLFQDICTKEIAIAPPTTVGAR